MGQFDVHRNTGRHKAVIPYLVIVQSRRFDRSRRRVVIPLVAQSEVSTPDPRLNPTFEIEDMTVVLNPLQLVSVATDRIGEHVGSLKSDGVRIIAAIDMLITRAFD